MFPTGSSKRVREKVRDQQSWFAFFAMHFFVDTSETEVTYWTKRKEILAYLRPGLWLFEALEEQIMKRQGTHVWRISARRRVPALPWRLLASLLLVFICVVHLTTRWSISTPSRSGAGTSKKQLHWKRAWTPLLSLSSHTCALSRLERRALQDCWGGKYLRFELLLEIWTFE